MEQTKAILNSSPGNVYKTVRALTVADGKEASHTVEITYGQLFSIFAKVAADAALVAGLLEEARKDTIEIAGGATSSSSVFPFTKEIEDHVGEIGGPIPATVSGRVTPAIFSFIVHRFGNKEI